MKNYFNTLRLDDKVVFENANEYWVGIVIGTITGNFKELRVKASPLTGGEEKTLDFVDHEAYPILIPLEKLDEFLPKSTANLIRSASGPLLTTAKFKVGKEYTWGEINDYCEEVGDISNSEYGINVVGENFITLTDEKDKTTSFILSGVSGNYIYRCVYSD